ncbi:TPA: TIGR03745 family integrating conjugative element membrane protein [Klebsiella oxytoca]|nr:TIGR03745 family integrating conjugative element membrane protein [Klebsiella oxytoca]HED2706012.1 TIGR03745 family integrating conjugative element membrane protein [Klebsiella oxytoca]
MRGLLLLLLPAFNALADLPEMEDPSRGQGDGIMETLQNYGYDMVILLTLAICAVGFLVVANNCIATYSEIQNGRKQWKDLGAMAGVGAILLVITIWLLNQASDIL